MMDLSQIPTSHLKVRLENIRKSRSYAASTQGQSMAERIENELQRRQPPNLCKSCARADVDCNIGAPGTAYCSEYRKIEINDQEPTP